MKPSGTLRPSYKPGWWAWRRSERILEEWTPSMTEEYGSLVVESEAVEPISRMKKERGDRGREGL